MGYDEVVTRAIYPGWLGLVAVLLWLPTGMAQDPARTAPALPDCGRLEGQVLRCTKLGFTYKVPFGWVDRTEEIQQPPRDSDPGQANPGQSGKALLAVFERPPGAPGESINSAVIIAIEDRSAYPQLKSAADYFGPLAEVAEQRGLKMNGEPYPFTAGTRQLVRADFTSGNEQAAARQTSLVVLQRSYILSLTFLSGSDDDINTLIENLKFTPGTKTRSLK